MENTLTEQRALPDEALQEYAGKWVAIRGEEVIASANSLAELREIEDVRRDDAVFVVPPTSATFF